MNIPEGWNLVPVDPPAQNYVKMPTTAEEAELMAKLGMMWLEQNAPDRLKTPPAQDTSNTSQWWKFLREHGDSDEFVCREHECQQKFFVHKNGAALPEECPSCKLRDKLGAPAQPISPEKFVRKEDGQIAFIACKDSDEFARRTLRTPAQEDEPIYFARNGESAIWFKPSANSLDWYKSHEWQILECYTRPQSDEIRKAAEDVLLIANEDDLSMKMIKAIDSLSAALDK